MTSTPAANTPDPAPSTAPAPTAVADRALAPDLARGALLLFIAIANSSWYLWAGTSRDLAGWPVEGNALDRVVQTISLIAIDGRSYPMFAALFGYGLWQLYSRQLALGSDPREAARLMRRRHLWMLAFGFVHAALLWGGDIIGAYGLAGLLVAWIFLGRRDRTLLTWAAIFAGLLSLAALGLFVLGLLNRESAGDGSYPSAVNGLGIATQSYGASIVERLITWGPATVVLAVAFAVPAMILVAIVAARHRILENPAEHRVLLRRVALIGISIAWLGGAVTAAQNAGLFGLPTSLDYMFSLGQAATGLAGGLGYVAVFGLIAARLTRVGPVTTAIRAVGTRSMTFYLAQSLVFAPVMSAWGLGLGAELSSWSIVAFAIVVWVVSVAVAALMERRGIRGPAETLLRRLTYRRRPA